MKLLLLVPGLALLALGTEGLYQASRGRVPIAIDCAEFAREQPPSNRLLVTGCELDYAGAGYRESGGEIVELYVPALPAGTPVPAPFVVASRNPSVLEAARALLITNPSATPEQSRAARERLTGLLRTNAIDGLARAGVLERFRSRRILSGLARPIAHDAAIVDLGGTPDFMRPTLALGAGILLALLPFVPRLTQQATEAAEEDIAGVDDTSRSERDSHVPADVIEPAAPAAAAVPGASGVALPRLLLLNVDHSAGPEAIEQAPPLGPRQEVTAILCGVIPDLRSGHTSRVLTRSDGSLTLDLGRHDPIPTVVIDARTEGGVALVREILLMTGWRAFAPKTGLFVTVDDLAAIEALTRESLKSEI